MHDETPRAVAETVVGVGLLFTPFWAQLLADVGLVASVVAQVAGAILGVYGVYRLLKDWAATTKPRE